MSMKDKAIQYSPQVKIKGWYWYLLALGLVMVVSGIAWILFL